MNEHEFKIFKQPFTEDGTLVVIQTGSLENFDVKIYNIREVVALLNEQQSTIQELERKVKKYAKIGEEQLKQIIELQDELRECRARPTLATDERGVVKVEYR